MRRGINHKRINITLDPETLAILVKYKNWGTPVSALIRKAVQNYDRRAKPVITQESSFEEKSVVYD